MFKDYLARQLRGREKLLQTLGISKSTYYRHLKDPTQITLGELRQMMIIGELDEDKVMDFICRRERK